jgi:hypothetical protein
MASTVNHYHYYYGYIDFHKRIGQFDNDLTVLLQNVEVQDNNTAVSCHFCVEV